MGPNEYFYWQNAMGLQNKEMGSPHLPNQQGPPSREPRVTQPTPPPPAPTPVAVAKEAVVETPANSSIVIAPPAADSNTSLANWQREMLMLQKKMVSQTNSKSSPWNFGNFTNPRNSNLEKTFSPNPWENAVAY